MRPNPATYYYNNNSNISIRVMCLVLIAFLLQNPFAFSTAFELSYKVIYSISLITLAVATFSGWVRLFTFGCGKEFTYYLYFVVATVGCILLNVAALGYSEPGNIIRYLFRYFQFFVVFIAVATIGSGKLLILGGRTSIILAVLAISHFCLNFLGMSNPFGDVQIATFDDTPFYWSVPFGFSNSVIPAGERFQEQSYFTEPANFGYFQLLFLIYYAYKHKLERKITYRAAIGILVISLLTTQSVATIGSLLILAVIPFTASRLQSFTLKDITLSLIALFALGTVLFGLVVYLINLKESVFQFRGLSIVMRALEWQQTFTSIMSNPLGYGIGVINNNLLVLDSETGLTKEYGGPTNFLLLFYQLGVPYLLPFLYWLRVLKLAYNSFSESSNDLKMTALMLLTGFLISISYIQFNTAVFQVTLALFFIERHKTTVGTHSNVVVR